LAVPPPSSQAGLPAASLPAGAPMTAVAGVAEASGLEQYLHLKMRVLFGENFIYEINL